MRHISVPNLMTLMTDGHRTENPSTDILLVPAPIDVISLNLFRSFNLQFTVQKQFDHQYFDCRVIRLGTSTIV